PSRAALHTPEELTSHGRAWSVAELRRKDWTDLHRLHWTCVKERNRLATTEATRKSTVGDKRSYGIFEFKERDDVCKATMRAIRHCLTERWYAWENAREAGMDDDEVDLYADPSKGEQAYLPKSEFVDEPVSLGSEDDARTDPSRGIPPPESRSPGGEARP
ncbi:Mitochondrial 39-S ribosomal protein L47 (MRP-L47), partial [Teratosphaeria destructans]